MVRSFRKKLILQLVGQFLSCLDRSYLNFLLGICRYKNDYVFFIFN